MIDFKNMHIDDVPEKVKLIYKLLYGDEVMPFTNNRLPSWSCGEISNLQTSYKFLENMREAGYDIVRKSEPNEVPPLKPKMINWIN